MMLPCVGLQRSIIYNVLWLLFALSFLWFPYIGMVTLPCRRKPLRRHTALRIREPLVDYTKVGEECMPTSNSGALESIKLSGSSCVNTI